MKRLILRGKDKFCSDKRCNLASGLRRCKDNFEKGGGYNDNWKNPKKVVPKKNVPRDKECVKEGNYYEILSEDSEECNNDSESDSSKENEEDSFFQYKRSMVQEIRECERTIEYLNSEN